MQRSQSGGKRSGASKRKEEKDGVGKDGVSKTDWARRSEQSKEQAMTTLWE